jgi:hypothetical protein
MGEVALILLTSGALGLGCIHSWRYLHRVRQAGTGDRAARERVLARYRGGNSAAAPPHQGNAEGTAPRIGGGD